MAIIHLARRSWRQLTSMRTALVLLFLLAVAAVPGSLLPQRSLGVEKVDAYRRANPQFASWLDRLGMFDVFSSPWFGAIYLLLFTSLVGCLLPRLREHAAALLRRPPPAPRLLSRLPAHADLGRSTLAPDDAAETLRGVLRSRRYRVTVRTEADGHIAVAGEKGYLRETGNLLFHFSLLALLVAVAVGYGWGWYGNRVLVAGPDGAFCTSVQQFDEYGVGARIDTTDIPGYCLELDQFTARYLDNGQPTAFRADVRWSAGRGAPKPYELQVNEPLRLDGATLYLLGHGYAPVLRYTDRTGRAQTTVAPFLPIDGMLTSEGVAMFPDANADSATGARSRDEQVAFSGMYVPTAPRAGPPALSAYPAERDPAVVLTAYRGNLGLDVGVPQSVYRLPRDALNDGRLSPIPGQPKVLRPGQRWLLDDRSTLEFLGTRPWISLTVRSDPGEPVALAGAIALLAGLAGSVAIHRRRIWFRVMPNSTGCRIEAAGLPRRDYSGFRAESLDLWDTARRRTGTVTAGRKPDEVDQGAVENTATVASPDADQIDSPAPR